MLPYARGHYRTYPSDRRIHLAYLATRDSRLVERIVITDHSLRFSQTSGHGTRFTPR